MKSEDLMSEEERSIANIGENEGSQKIMSSKKSNDNLRF